MLESEVFTVTQFLEQWISVKRTAMYTIDSSLA